MKIILSKLQWNFIGRKAGWIKIATPIEVDGTWYDEDETGNLIEIPPPVAPAEPKSKTVLGITFTEGEEYENWYGTYEVVRILNDETMEVRYLRAFRSDVRAGEIKQYPMLAQARTIINAQQINTAQMAAAANLNAINTFTQPDEFFTLGFIASHGYISAEVGPKYHRDFPITFKAVTGDLPDPYLGKGYNLSNNYNRWSYTLRVKFSSPPANVLSGLKLPKNHIVRKLGIEINDNAFIWGLFKLGFRPGKNDNRVQTILANIPASSRNDFVDGFNA